ncbi:MAG TPA: 3-dehydroquinate synthase family protein [Verrucomicrobiae bacterium]|nr:3-dehydroquinate synthase family protein [Verrucomicrobiae bacterium]
MAAQEEDFDLGALVVNDDLGYPVVVGGGLRESFSEFVRARGGRWVMLCDANPAVVRIARAYARKAGGALAVIPVALGERRKRLATVERVLDALVRAGADRGTLVVGVGGGVASDLFGFAAACYMRGVGYAHVATSLVAMVDAAIGGKTGVDLQGGKNLAGVFRDPLAVFCDVEALQTLPYRSLREGLAEVVKAAVIEGDELFDSLELLAAHPFWRWPWEDLVARAVKVKTAVVADDRLESGMRELLNLGHTFAHGIERASEFAVTHGAAVALGLRAAGLLALRTGRFSQGEHLRVLTLLALLRMPLRTSLAPDAILSAMQSDKKKRGGELRFVLPRAIGDVEYGVTVSPRLVREVLARMQRPPEAVR